MEKRHMEFGFQTYPPSRIADPDELARIVKRGDELGYFSVGLAEHMFPPPEATQVLANEYWPDLPTLAAFLGGITERIRFEISVSVIPYHPPVQYAKQLATVDVVTKGRLILGVGAGWFEEEFQRLGVPFAERGAITDEYLAAMIELWTSERPSFSGKYVSFDDVTFYPKPVQKPHIPLFIGGTGKRPAERAATVGSAWHPMVGTLEERQAFFSQVEKLAAEQGRDPDSIWMTGNVEVSANPHTEQAKQHVSSDRYADYRAEASREELIAAVKAQQAAGVDLVYVGFRWDTPDELIRGLERFADDVIPAFR